MLTEPEAKSGNSVSPLTQSFLWGDFEIFFYTFEKTYMKKFKTNDQKKQLIQRQIFIYLFVKTSQVKEKISSVF